MFTSLQGPQTRTDRSVLGAAVLCTAGNVVVVIPIINLLNTVPVAMPPTEHTREEYSHLKTWGLFPILTVSAEEKKLTL